MRDAAGQLPHRLHLLALRELNLQCPLFGRVDRVGDRRFARVLRVRDGVQIDAPAALTRPGKGYVDGIDQALAGNGGLQGLAQILPVTLVHERLELDLPASRIRIGAEHARESCVGGADRAVSVDGRDGEGRGLEDAGVAETGCVRLLRFARSAIEN